MINSDREELNVLLVTTSFPVAHNRASGVFIERLADSLSQHIQIRVVTPSPLNCAGMTFDYPVHYFRYAPRQHQKLAHQPGGIPVALRKNLWNILLLPGFIIALFSSVLRHGRHADVIHANWGIPGLISVLAAMIIRKPVVTTLRGTDVYKLKDSLVTSIIIGMVLRLSRRVVSVSKSIKQELSETWPNLGDKIEVIPNGVDEGFLQIERYETPKEPFRLLTAGNLVANKDISTIIRAISQLSDPVRLRIAGDGEERPNLEHLCESLKIQDHVTFLGIVPPDKMKEELENSDIFVLASHSEGRPNVVLEAMASGCAVVASNLPGVTELIEDDTQGVLFAPGDLQSLASILQNLINEPYTIQQLGMQGRRRIQDMGLTWDRCAQNYIHQYSISIAS